MVGKMIVYYTELERLQEENRRMKKEMEDMDNNSSTILYNTMIDDILVDVKKSIDDRNVMVDDGHATTYKYDDDTHVDSMNVKILVDDNHKLVARVTELVSVLSNTHTHAKRLEIEMDGLRDDNKKMREEMVGMKNRKSNEEGVLERLRDENEKLSQHIVDLIDAHKMKMIDVNGQKDVMLEENRKLNQTVLEMQRNPESRERRVSERINKDGGENDNRGESFYLRQQIIEYQSIIKKLQETNRQQSDRIMSMIRKVNTEQNSQRVDYNSINTQSNVYNMNIVDSIDRHNIYNSSPSYTSTIDSSPRIRFTQADIVIQQLCKYIEIRDVCKTPHDATLEYQLDAAKRKIGELEEKLDGVYGGESIRKGEKSKDGLKKYGEDEVIGE